MAYTTIVDELTKSKIWNLTNDMIEFPNGYVEDFNKDNNFSLLEIYELDYGDVGPLQKLIILYKKCHLFPPLTKFGSIISYMHSMYNIFGEYDHYQHKFNPINETTKLLAKFMMIDDIGVDLLTISKLFNLNNFNNLQDDFKLLLYEPLKNCFDHMTNVSSKNAGEYIIRQSPCLDLKNNLACKNFCEWHNKLIHKKLSKGELLTLMRYIFTSQKVFSFEIFFSHFHL